MSQCFTRGSTIEYILYHVASNVQSQPKTQRETPPCLFVSKPFFKNLNPAYVTSHVPLPGLSRGLKMKKSWRMLY